MAHNNLRSSKEKRAYRKMIEYERQKEMQYLSTHRSNTKAEENFKRPAYSVIHPKRQPEEE